MPQIIFAFTMDTETKAATFTGNVAPGVALGVLQDIAIAEAVRRRAKDNGEKPAANKPKKAAKKKGD